MLYVLRKKMAISLFLALAFNLFGIVLAVKAGKEAKCTPHEAKDETLFSAVAKMYLPSLVAVEAEELKQQQRIKEKNEEALFEKKRDAWVIPGVGGTVEKLRLVYQLFDADSAQKGDLLASKQNVLGASTAQDIELFCGPSESPEHHLFSRLDNTQTAFGKVMLQTFLCPRFSEINELKREISRRSSIVKYLVDTKNEEIFQRLDEQLETINASEGEMMWFWKEMNKITKTYFNSIYPKFGLHENALAQELSAEWTRFVWPITLLTFYPQLIVAEAGGLGLNFLLDGKDMSINNAWQNLKDNVSACMEFYKGHPIPKLLSNYSTFRKVLDDKYISKDPLEPWRLRLSFPALLATLIVTYFFVISAYHNFVKLNKVSSQMHTKLNNAASISNAATELGNILKSDQVLSDLMPNFNDLLESADSEMNALFASLAKNTFKGDASFWSNKGRVMACFKKMLRLKDGFVGKLKAIGEIDALMSVAKFYKQHANNADKPVCFAEIVESDKPYIKMQQVWHIQLDKPMSHDVELGSDVAGHNMILTGPNACGKSVYLRELVIALLLATSFGIAPAAECKITPFAKIATYLNIADNVGKESLYQAELNQAKELLEYDKNLKAGEFMFVDIDEPFTGTNPEEARNAAYNLAKGFGQQSICVFATHFHELTDLEATTNGYFKNHKVYVEILPDQTLKCTYKVIPGISDQRIATIMAKQTLGKYLTK